ncbi:hypothetical protein Ddc_14773 [Ditylenchus destructor]|nr:hypothetical protein Ddc_14773 [Ditylenchus destructor]
MSALPNEIFSDMTKFLPNDDITDLMLMSRTFNALVTPRLQKINQDLTTMNQSIKSPVPEINDDKWIAQLNLKRFEPIGSVTKKRAKNAFERFRNGEMKVDEMALKERMSLERFDDVTFLRILAALVATPKFREEYNISQEQAGIIQIRYVRLLLKTMLERLNLT